MGHILSCSIHEFLVYMERHNRVLYLVVRAVLSSIGLKIPKELARPGGVAKPGVYGTKQQEVRVDQLIPTREKVSINIECPWHMCHCTLYHAQIKQRRMDIMVKQSGTKTIHIADVACAWEPLVKAEEREK